MRLEPLYRLRWSYPEHWAAGDLQLLFADGTCEGRLVGRFRAANRAVRRADGSFLPELNGAVETSEGAVLVRIGGYGWPDAGRASGWVMHYADGEEHGWLNDVVGVFAADVSDGVISLEVAELVWEPLV